MWMPIPNKVNGAKTNTLNLENEAHSNHDLNNRHLGPTYW